jgi:two-component system, NarL family, sensor kinase
MTASMELKWTVLVTTAVVVLLLVFLVTLMNRNTNRRLQHRAALAEAERLRNAEVQRAEREATQHTLREVGRELHDNVAQLLTVAQLGLGNVLEEPAPDGRLLAARDALDQGIEEVRRLGHDLNSDRWRQRSLRDAIGTAAERIERVGRVRALVVQQGHAPEPDADTRIILFRVFQEVVNNALKHSGADTLTITLHGTAALALTIADNGRGFDPAHTASAGGLLSIRKRCALVGYAAHCTSTPGQGCTWTIGPEANDHGT